MSGIFFRISRSLLVCFFDVASLALLKYVVGLLIDVMIASRLIF